MSSSSEPLKGDDGELDEIADADRLRPRGVLRRRFGVLLRLGPPGDQVAREPDPLLQRRGPVERPVPVGVPLELGHDLRVFQERRRQPLRELEALHDLVIRVAVLRVLDGDGAEQPEQQRHAELLVLPALRVFEGQQHDELVQRRPVRRFKVPPVQRHSRGPDRQGVPLEGVLRPAKSRPRNLVEDGDLGCVKVHQMRKLCEAC